MFVTRLLLALFFVEGFATSAASVETCVANVTRLGQLRGLCASNYSMFLGVRYALAPTGERRWRSPIGVSPWQGEHDATAYGASCLQAPNFDPPMGILNEDCLFLNVYAPPQAKLAPRNDGLAPVMVWIHGGSYTGGSGNEQRTNGTYLVELTAGNLVVVTVNYRLAAFGFLGSTKLRSRSLDGSVGNYGIQDQRLALQWVHDNVDSFGGDASKVLIAGQSSGAGCVSHHLVMKRSFGLYHRAAMQSGAFSKWISQPMDAAEQDYEAFLQSSGCSNVTCLQGLDAEVIVQAQGGWGPVVDGVELADTPWALAEAGSIAPGVAIIAGDVAADSGQSIAQHAKFNAFRNYAQDELKPLGINSTVVDNLAGLYKNETAFNDFSGPYWAAKHLLADAEMLCPARRAARWFNKSGAFLFQFQYPPPLLGAGAGAAHAGEIPFVFHVLNGPLDKYRLNGKAERDLGAVMGKFWAQFASTGSPGFVNEIEWPRWTEANASVMLFNTEACPLPTSFTTPGKDCPSQDPSSCFNSNVGYSSLSQAWTQCGVVNGCGGVMAYSDGFYYLRRNDDPDSAESTTKWYSYQPCLQAGNVGIHSVAHFREKFCNAWDQVPVAQTPMDAKPPTLVV